MNSTPTSPAQDLRNCARRSRRVRILEFFASRLRQRFSSAELHDLFGSSFRTRVSELNRDPKCPARILNANASGTNESGRPCEQSVYWAELRSTAERTVPVESDFMRKRRAEEAAALPLFAGVRDA